MPDQLRARANEQDLPCQCRLKGYFAELIAQERSSVPRHRRVSA